MNRPDSSGETVPGPGTVGEIQRQRHRYGTMEQQFADLYLPITTGRDQRRQLPVVILIHGGFWYAAYGLDLMHPLALDLAQRGYAVWNIEYRRIGDPGGGWPGTFTDVVRAIEHLTQLTTEARLDLRQVVSIGHSAGGHLALWSAAHARLRDDHPIKRVATSIQPAGLISQAGVADLEYAWKLRLGGDAVQALLGGSPTEVPERYASVSPAALVPLGVPQVIIHGTNDNRVPHTVSQRYLKKALAAGDQVTLIELPGVDHFAIIDPTTQAWDITIKEVQRLFASI